MCSEKSSEALKRISPVLVVLSLLWAGPSFADGVFVEAGGPYEGDAGAEIEFDAGASANPGGWPQGRALTARIAAIPNRHLEYALTWWGLALTLIGVYAAFAYSRVCSVGQFSK